MNVYALISTIPHPERKRSVARLLSELATVQTRKVDGVILRLDGYGHDSRPSLSLPILFESRSPKPSGAGGRWALVTRCHASDIIICIDDDCVTLKAPRMIESLVRVVEETDGAAAAMGRRYYENAAAPPGDTSFGRLVHGAGCGLAARARHLSGVMAFGQEIFAEGGPDCLGVGGDDDSLVSAWLWKSKVPIVHAATGVIYEAPNCQSSSYTNGFPGRAGDEQKQALKRMTGWPWPCPPGKWQS